MIVTSADSPTQILVVDDEQDMEFWMNEYFAREISARQYEFNFARSRIEALEKLKTNHYHLGLIDIVMPDDDYSSVGELDNVMPEQEDLSLKSGLILIKQAHRQAPDFEPIILTGYCNDIKYLKYGYEVGAKNFINKPIERDKLYQLSQNRRLLTKSRLPKISNESQKKIPYQTARRIACELTLELRYQLALDLIKTFTLQQFKNLSLHLGDIETSVREEQEKREKLLRIDTERVEQGKFPLLPLEEGTIDERPYAYKQTDGEISQYRYLYLRCRDPKTKRYTTRSISKEHLKDPEVRKIIERKLGKPLDPEFL
jgi:CheY-like chemotaxis protein